jgi:peptidoglycan/xylan/chitin deacetylase (PgdA/CDA1 family)
MLRARIAPAAHWIAHATGVSSALARRRPGARIIMHHGVTRETARAFAAQVDYLAARFAIVPLREILQRLGTREGPRPNDLALTFDDGLRNNATIAYPILRRRGVTATFFVCPGLIDAHRWLWNHDARERLASLAPGARAELARAVGAPAAETEPVIEWMKTLDVATRADVETTVRAATPRFAPTRAQRERFDLARWADRRALDPRVVEIGSHTMSHVILAGLGADDAVREVAESRRVLERRLARPVELFAYPNGVYDDQAVAIVRRSYRGAVSTIPAVVGRDDDPHRAPRIPAPDGLPLLAWRLHRPAA